MRIYIRTYVYLALYYGNHSRDLYKVYVHKDGVWMYVYIWMYVWCQRGPYREVPLYNLSVPVFVMKV